MPDKPKTLPLRKIENLPGFVTHWLLCGPFNENSKLSGCRALKKDYLNGEDSARPRAGQRVGGDGPAWRPFAIRHGFIANLRLFYSSPGIVSYALAYLLSPRAQPARIWLGSDDGFLLFLNGERIAARDIHRGLGVDSDSFGVKLKKGVNVMLMKVEQDFGAYEFCLRVTGPAGKGIPGLRSYLDHPRVKNPVDPARARTVSGYDYLNHKFASAGLSLAFRAKTPAQFKSWKRKFLAKYKNLLGPLPKSCPLKPQITEEITIEKYFRRRVLIDFEPGFSIPCFVTVPKRIPKGHTLPAVLCLHGHGGGKRDMVGELLGTPHEASWSEPYAIALHAARAGYITISPDFLAFGERLGARNMYGEGQDPCPAQFAWGQMAGVLPTAVNIATVKRCIDYLQQLPEVDSRRIAAVGHSFGGYMTTMSTAIERRIKVAVISGFMMTSAAYQGRPWTCGSQVVGGLLQYGDLSDIACTFVPRPTLIITGKYDDVTPFPFAEAACKKIKKAYRVAGVPDKTSQFVFPGDHIFQPEAALEWLDTWL
jgi:dienelactone hydrolase